MWNWGVHRPGGQMLSSQGPEWTVSQGSRPWPGQTGRGHRGHPRMSRRPHSYTPPPTPYRAVTGQAGAEPCQDHVAGQRVHGALPATPPPPGARRPSSCFCVGSTVCWTPGRPRSRGEHRRPGRLAMGRPAPGSRGSQTLPAGGEPVRTRLRPVPQTGEGDPVPGPQPAPRKDPPRGARAPAAPRAACELPPRS